MKAAIISDTHSWMDERIEAHLSKVDEIWHAGDIGSLILVDKLKSIRPLRAVYGNIDGTEVRTEASLDQLFEVAGMKVWMTHIGGYPGRYDRRVREKMPFVRPDIFISGHSHILKVVRDHKYNLLHINPGSCGKHGIHKFRTLILLEINNGQITDLKVVELGKRGVI